MPPVVEAMYLWSRRPMVVCGVMSAMPAASRSCRRGILALAALAALLLPLGEAHHGPHWDGADATAEHLVFAEAAHPWQAPHFDAAAAPEIRSCTACLHRHQSGHARITTPAGFSVPADDGSRPASPLRELTSLSLTTASPRGPPLLTS